MKLLVAIVIMMFSAHQSRADINGLKEFRQEVAVNRGSFAPFNEETVLQRAREVEAGTKTFLRNAHPTVRSVMDLIFEEHTMLMAIIRVNSLNHNSLLAKTMKSEMVRQYRLIQSSLDNISDHVAGEGSLSACHDFINKVNRVLQSEEIKFQELADCYVSITTYCKPFYYAPYANV